MKGKRGVGHEPIAAKPGAAKPGKAKPDHRRSARSPQQQHTSPSKTDDANETNDRKP
jgi:hypothetical protein